MKPVLKIGNNGDKRWYLNGKLHREDGPAVIYPNGSKYWYLNGTRLELSEIETMMALL